MDSYGNKTYAAVLCVIPVPFLTRSSSKPWLLSTEGSESKDVTRLIKLLVALLKRIGRYIFKKNDFIDLLLQRITAILRELNAFLLEAIGNCKYNTQFYYNLV